jgi:phosphoglycerate dehydrogenase-like enzyme
MIGATELALMRRGAYLLNASRGSVVDLEALAAAIRDGRLGGAAVDVHPDEPKAERGVLVAAPRAAQRDPHAARPRGRVAATAVELLTDGSCASVINRRDSSRRL